MNTGWTYHLSEEAKIGEQHCYWCNDEFGLFFVSGLSLYDHTKAMMITKNGFEMVSIGRKVFISYTKEDVSYVKTLYQILKRHGAQPWLDEEDLLPGQKWQIEIEAHIYDSDYFIDARISASDASGIK